jgi:ABC-type multidrug transport system ATPase subunit
VPSISARFGYVQNSNASVETITVREALLFSAKLRQLAGVSATEKAAQ